MKYSHAIVAAIAALTGSVQAHTWIESLHLIKDGKYVDAGYSRSYIKRDAAGGQDGQYLVSQGQPKVTPDATVCSPKEQNQKQASMPRLQAAPGDYIALRYLENGHVSKYADVDMGAGKRPNSFTYIYATTKPVAGTKMDDVFGWTSSSSLEKGKLLTTGKYDDGRCAQKNGTPTSTKRLGDGPEIECENDFQIPDGVKAGTTLTIYWVWDWSAFDVPALEKYVRDEVYTSCIDIDIVAKSSDKQFDDPVTKDALSSYKENSKSSIDKRDPTRKVGDTSGSKSDTPDSKPDTPDSKSDTPSSSAASAPASAPASTPAATPVSSATPVEPKSTNTRRTTRTVTSTLITTVKPTDQAEGSSAVDVPADATADASATPYP